jgi:hypothetical protein
LPAARNRAIPVPVEPLNVGGRPGRSEVVDHQHRVLGEERLLLEHVGGVRPRGGQAPEGDAEMRLCDRRQLRLEHTSRAGQMDGEVDQRGFSQRRAVHRTEQWCGERVSTEVENGERRARCSDCLISRRGFRQIIGEKAIDARLDFNGVKRPIGTDAGPVVQEDPLTIDPPPAQMAVDGAPRHDPAQHLDRGAQVIPLALARENHGRHSPCLGHPAHWRVALCRDSGGRKPMTACQLTLDHKCRALFGAVVEHLLRDYPGGEVAQGLGHHALARLLAPPNHAVPGDEVGPRLDGSFEAGTCASALDHTQVRPPDLTIEVAHASPGLLQTAHGPLVGGGVA